MKTLLLALISTDKSKGTREGAIRGLIGVGKEAIRKGLVEGGGAKVVGSECGNGETGPLVGSVLVCPSRACEIRSTTH
jgi:transcription initiation factor TFIID subunit 6